MNTSASSLSSGSLSRFVSAFLAVLVASLVGVSACGRSSLDQYLLTDGGPPSDSPTDSPHPDGGGCNLATCPNGCCDANGVCQTGTTNNQCGIGGQVCQDCIAEGFQFCSLPSHSCANKVPVCDAQTCANGCCGGPNTCFAGNSSSECGTGGGPCQNCLQLGEQCTGQQCTQAACGPNNCKGCCFGDQCLGGTDQTACGEAGQQCQNCAGMGEQCVPQGGGGLCEVTQKCSPQNCPGCCDPNTGVCVKGGANNDCGFGGQTCQNCTQFGEVCGFNGQCVPNTMCGPMTCPGCCDPNTGACTPGFANNDCGLFGQTCQNCSAINDVCNGKGQCIPPVNMCNPMTCPFGCCDANNICQNGMQDGSCGFGGNACQNCLALGDTCQGQVCQSMTPCSQNCAGCCDNNNQCQPGFLNKQCGEFGATCIDCTQQASTCDVNVMPRTCANMQMQCPAPYGGCDPSLETPQEPQQQVCSANELSNARSACSGGAFTAGCQAYFQFEFQQNPNCGVCLSNFDYDFNQLTGLFTCIAPFVDMTCNHNTACDSDCTTQSCDQCPDQQTQDQCINQVQNGNGQCSSYYMASGCVIQAFLGQGSFCNPQMYNNNFGRWLQGVGQYYCGM